METKDAPRNYPEGQEITVGQSGFVKTGIEIRVVPLNYPEGCNIIVGQSHFIKTVEDLAEIVISSVPGIKYGLAFCEASGPCLIRTEGNAPDLITSAAENARAVGAGHTFFLLIREAFPINILNQIKNCQEVTRIFCATANPLQILCAGNEQGNGILGVIDGFAPRGIESEEDKKARKGMLRQFGYKF